MTLDDPDVALLEAAAREAGSLALSFFRNSPRTWSKQGGSPVTEADMAVDALLRERLLAARPGLGWLSEETADDRSRLAAETTFVVDPIDGTRAFIAGDDRWCVSLAIVRNGRPVSAALYAPARGELFVAAAGQGAWRDGARLAVSSRAALEGAHLAGPRGWLMTPAIVRLGAELAPHVPSLAYRFALVADARLDAAFASPNAHDWDLAASDLLVHEAGGRLVGLDGAAPLYNRDVPRHDVLAASNGMLQSRIVAAVSDAAREVQRGRRAETFKG